MAIHYDNADENKGGFTSEQMNALIEGASEHQVRLALQKVLHVMAKLGFGTDEEISGADAVDAIGEVFAEVTEEVLQGQG
ncbi:MULTISPECIES: hypothetical protein [Cupriavidus]|jgi:hypothetical protein|uniref:hypothetical protein n=1 Tax=Cupriavidus TaxID=106589 RepID=UPI000CE0296B|nr:MULTISPECIES: hypothetical protein [Cupriavidus]AVA38024.1 hypothetical protein C3Z06_30905 [Cupriavidus metallidurans]QWE97999.1 hypothetical protein KLP38_29330 [Cupriavidus sp. EM10]